MRNVYVGSDSARIVDDQRREVVEVDDRGRKHSLDDPPTVAIKVDVAAGGKLVVYHKEAATIDIRRAGDIETGIHKQSAASSEIKVSKCLNRAAIHGSRARKYRPVAIGIEKTFNLQPRAIEKGQRFGSQG